MGTAKKKIKKIRKRKDKMNKLLFFCILYQRTTTINVTIIWISMGEFHSGLMDACAVNSWIIHDLTRWCVFSFFSKFVYQWSAFTCRFFISRVRKFNCCKCVTLFQNFISFSFTLPISITNYESDLIFKVQIFFKYENVQS